MTPIESFLVNILQKELRPEYGILCKNSVTDYSTNITRSDLIMGDESFSIEYSMIGDVFGNIRFACSEFLREHKPFEFAMNQIKLKGINETNLIDLYFILKSIYEPRTIPGSTEDNGNAQEVKGMEIDGGVSRPIRGRPPKTA